MVCDSKIGFLTLRSLRSSLIQHEHVLSAHLTESYFKLCIRWNKSISHLYYSDFPLSLIKVDLFNPRVYNKFSETKIVWI